MNLKLLTGLLLSLITVQLTLPSAARPEGLNFITEVKGNVKLKRANRPRYQQAKEGTILRSGDRLRVEPGAKAAVLCNNLYSWSVPAGKESAVSEGCPPVLRPPHNGPGRLRDPNYPTIPYIISPRNTALLNGKPTFRWNPVKGASQYKVIVRGPGITTWTTTVDQPEVVYAGPDSFIPGMRYRVIVTDIKTGQSSASERVTGFSILSNQDIQRVKEELERLEQTPLRRESQVLAQAHFYRGNELNLAAIESLEQAIREGSQTTPIYQLLGELYQQVGLNRLAEKPYLRAVELAKANDDIEGQAIAQDNLGQVYVTLAGLENLKNAIAFLQEAQTNYQTLGDEERVQELQKQIDDLLQRIEG